MDKKNQFNPFISILTKPKETILKIVEKDPNYKLWLLSIIYGLVSILGFSQSISIGYKYNFFLIVFVCLLLSIIWGYVAFSVSSFFVYITGKWLKGIASYKSIRASFAWSNVPMIINILIWIILLIIFQDKIFKDFPNNYILSKFEMIVLFSSLFLQLIVSVYVIVLYINTIASVQNFSILRSIFNIILSLVLAFLITLVISFLFYIITKGIKTL
ncbi:MAG: hypothetical protein K1060chlam5_00438 [Candidatus Anoxychlamydiales bacterium]|nr:hypothetical protein [Candidatus Anoxychlamydiales bacterium]